MTDPEEGAAWSSSTPAGPSLSFAFNLAKIADHGEDADPILRAGPDLGLVGVFDGMGGAGGTVYETPDGPRTGAYLASRIARDVVEERLLDLLEPDWDLKGRATAEDLGRAVRAALEDRLVELKAPTSRLRSKLLRALPTTMSVVALQRSQRGGSSWACHVFWAGDSRSYVVTADGGEQLHPDDLRDPGDALANLHHDSVVSNAMSADTDFVVNYRRVELTAPFLIVSATDGCFGYLPTPMHFEHVLLAALSEADTADGWSAAVQDRIAAVTGDDAAMAVLGVGADLTGFSTLLGSRSQVLAGDFVAPLDQLTQSVQDAEQALEAARTELQDETTALWGRYQPGYERALQEPTADEPRVGKWWHDARVPAGEDPGPGAGSPPGARNPATGTAHENRSEREHDLTHAEEATARPEGASS